MYNDLIQLASEKSSSKRGELIGRISNLFVEGANRFSDEEVVLFGDVIARLLKDVGLHIRADLAVLVAPITQTPNNLVVRLAHDDVAVATPILRQSATLVVSDLIQIAAEKTIGHRVAISIRPNIVKDVTDFLIRYDEQEVLRGISANASAEISDWGFEQLAVKATQDNSILNNLCIRKDITLDATKTIMPVLSVVARQKLASLIAGLEFDTDEKIIEVTANANTEKGAFQAHLIQVNSLILQIKTSDRKLDDVCRYLASEDRHLDLSLVLSTFSGIPERHISRAFAKVSGDMIALLCRSLELSPRTFAEVSEMWCNRMNLPSSHKQWLIHQYDDMAVETARRSVRLLRPIAGLNVA